MCPNSRLRSGGSWAGPVSPPGRAEATNNGGGYLCPARVPLLLMKEEQPQQLFVPGSSDLLSFTLFNCVVALGTKGLFKRPESTV